MKKLLIITLFAALALPVFAQDYVDLGLHSGTLWKSQNEPGMYSYDNAITMFGQSLPTIEQWEELKNECRWSWAQRGGYLVIGPNGNSIYLAAEGLRSCDKEKSPRSAGSSGHYWTSKPYDSESAWFFVFNKDFVDTDAAYRCAGRSVRLVK